MLTARQESKIMPGQISFGGICDMVKIRTQQKCRCGNGYTSTARGLFCSNCKSPPRTYYLDWYWLGERMPKLSGFDSYRSAALKAASIEQEIETGEFNPSHYLGNGKTRNTHKTGFEKLFSEWLVKREKDAAKGIISPAHIQELQRRQGLYTGYFHNTDVRTIHEKEIDDFFHSMPDHLKPKSQKNYMALLHAFFEYLHVLKVIREVPDFPKIQVQRPAVKWAETDTQELVMQHITPERNRLIFKTMIETGMRPQEARALYPEDFSYRRKTITVQRAYSREELRSITKTRQVRILPISESLAEAINEMLIARPAAMIKEHLFKHDENTHYTQGRLYKIWARACKNAGVKGVSMYGGTRHSFASNRINDGQPLELIGAYMGHNDRSTTQQYAHVSGDGLRKVVYIDSPKTVLTGSKKQ